MESPAGPSISVVLAAHNEARVIGRVIADLKGTGYDIIVVDDGSSDGTGEVAAAGGAVVIKHLINLGQGAALQPASHLLWRKGRM